MIFKVTENITQKLKDEYYHYKDANGQVQKGVDQFNLTDKDIVVKSCSIYGL